MKKLVNLIGMLLVVLLAVMSYVNAANIGVVIEPMSGDAKTYCVNTESGLSAYDILQKTSAGLTWSSGSIFGHALCKVFNAGDEPSGTICAWTDFWSLFINDNGVWRPSPVGFDGSGGCWNGDLNSFTGHLCVGSGQLIGLARVSTSSSSAYYQNTPPSTTFNNVCGLQITDVTSYVGGEKDTNIKDGEIISDDAKPQDDVEFRVEVSNTFSKDIEIKNIEIIVTIANIDDGDDLEETSDEFDLDSGRSKKETLNYAIPLIVDEDDYDVIIEAEGKGSDGVIYRDEMTLTLQVSKEKHRIEITDSNLMPEIVSCGDSATLNVEITNLGQEDEDKVGLEIINTELGLNFKETNLELDSSGDDAIYFKSILITPKDKVGTYNIDIKTSYDSKADDKVTIPLKVEKCIVEDTTITKPNTEKETVKNEVVVEKKDQQYIVSPITTYAVKEPEPSIFDKNKTTILLVGADLVLIILAGILIGYLFRKNRK